MQLYYATRDGQSQRIMARIAERLAERGVVAKPWDLRNALPAPTELTQASLIVLVAAVRYGHHLPEAECFLAEYAALPAPPRLVLLSVNLSARKAGKETAQGNGYLRKLVARYRLRPVLARAVAGRLDYARYGWLDRQMIRFIMKLTGGPTAPDACVDFTPWATVDALAAQIADIFGPPAIRGTPAKRDPLSTPNPLKL